MRWAIVVHLTQSIDCVVEFSSAEPLLFLFVLGLFCLVDLLIWDRRILISITNILDSFIFPVASFGFTHSHISWHLDVFCPLCHYLFPMLFLVNFLN